MRSKLIALAVVSGLALVGCSTAESTPEPVPTVTVTAAPSASAAPSLSTDTVADEDAFLGQLSIIKEKEDQLAGALKEKADDSYLLKRGEKYCDLLSEKEIVEPIYSNGKDATDLQIETMILQSARTNLCPATSN